MGWAFDGIRSCQKYLKGYSLYVVNCGFHHYIRENSEMIISEQTIRIY